MPVRPQNNSKTRVATARIELLPVPPTIHCKAQIADRMLPKCLEFTHKLPQSCMFCKGNAEGGNMNHACMHAQGEAE